MRAQSLVHSPMANSFSYHNGWLHCEEVNIKSIAKQVGTPFYLYSTRKISSQFAIIKQLIGSMDARIYYAMKANSNLAVLRHLHNLGAGFDVVSGGEFQKAIKVGSKGSSIIFSGVGKTKDELELTLKGNIKQFNIESFPELLALNEVAGQVGIRAPVSIRVNPDVDANTHEKISTGRAGDKFGIPILRAAEFFQLANQLEWVEPKGIDIHIGSQITSVDPFKKAFNSVAKLVMELRQGGHVIDFLDIGGGLGIPYNHECDTPFAIEEYFQLIRDIINPLDCEIELEPGRFIVAEAGVLVSEVIYEKSAERNILIIDAAMNDLIRPTLYSAYHPIVAIKKSSTDQPLRIYDVVGPVCETGDTFTRGRELPSFNNGDLLAFLNAGAYGAVMASEYNTRPLVPEVLVGGSHWQVVRERPSFQAMIEREKIPDWL